MMRNVLALSRKGVLTDQQVLAAAQFSRAPNTFTLAPSLYRVLHDLIIRDEPMEAYERKRGWPARSAKLMLSQLLYALQEVQGAFWGAKGANEHAEALSVIDYLAGDDHNRHFALGEQYGLTPTEARLFVVLHSQNAPISRDTALRRLYHGRNADEIPNPNVLDVMISTMRGKLQQDWVIRTIWGEGFVLERVRSEKATDAA